MKKSNLIMYASICTALLTTGCNSQQEISYQSNIQPVINKHCAECHLPGGSGAVASEFLVDSYDNLIKGTKFGPVIVAGDALSSSLYRLVSGKVHKSIQMPHSKEPLTELEITALENWINQGAQNN